MKLLGMTSAAVLLSAATSCSDWFTSPQCVYKVLVIRAEPRDTTIHVQQSFTPNVRLEDACGNRLFDRITYTASNDSILTVNAGSGRTTGRREGEAVIHVQGVKYRHVIDIVVTVIR